jgi:hypothetical protein
LGKGGAAVLKRMLSPARSASALRAAGCALNAAQPTRIRDPKPSGTGLLGQHLLGTEEFMITNHTDCGMLTFRDEDLRARLEAQWETAAVVPAHFYAFSELEQNVREQIQKVRSHPWVPDDIPVRGFVHDVKTGRLNEVQR